jgi:hypothetical protein
VRALPAVLPRRGQTEALRQQAALKGWVLRGSHPEREGVGALRLVEKHGTRTRRSWRKLHLGVDADTGRIVASALTGHDADDGAQVDRLLDQVEGPVASFTGDGAYDQASVYDSVAERHPAAAVIVPPRATAVPSPMAETDPTQRDRHLQSIAEHGRMGWQKASGYNRRALAEVSAVRACETDRGFSGTEDFWIIVAIRSEDEAEIRAGESAGRADRQGHPARGAPAFFG